MPSDVDELGMLFVYCWVSCDLVPIEIAAIRVPMGCSVWGSCNVPVDCHGHSVLVEHLVAN